MPFYEYKCSDCGFELEELQKMSDEPLKKCPNCGKETLQKLIGTGGGLIFKGSGFYQTDYKKKNTTEPAAPLVPKTEGSKKETNKPADKPSEKKTAKAESKKQSNTKKEK
ncbi:MAG: zinc ribbon domain-containing protein [Ignavibacteria bacterium]